MEPTELKAPDPIVERNKLGSCPGCSRLIRAGMYVVPDLHGALWCRPCAEAFLFFPRQGPPFGPPVGTPGDPAPWYSGTGGSIVVLLLFGWLCVLSMIVLIGPMSSMPD